ncbi:MAG: SUMF1/EgtB/PvdO family nonheme iron enzyme [Chloroflexota bacterium]
MTKIFISYRRADTQYVTDAIHLVMRNIFGADNVFLDVGSIPFGVDFREYLSEQVAAHDVVLVIIGSDWARIMEERAEQANDFVRIEIESAMKQKKLVIPVLVKNASMPDFTNLPQSIQDLQWRNSAIIRRQPDLENDCKRLADGIKQYITTNTTKSEASVRPASSETATREVDNLRDNIAQKIETYTQESTFPEKQNRPDVMPEPFEWIEIPEGKTIVRGKPVTVTAFSMAKYPITNVQYEKFVESGGYKKPRWWTAHGWATKEEKGWEKPSYFMDEKWNTDLQPVIGVSYFEAVAFCNWLSTITREKIMLPTESQWQYAAQGSSGLVFPWGNQWDCTRCNNSVSPCKNEVTTAVTQYKGLGDSPFGVTDMVGNTREWCFVENLDENHAIKSEVMPKLLRGATYLTDQIDRFRSDSPYGKVYLSMRRTLAGFRIVCNKTN